MPLATIHTRSIVPDFIISPIINCPALSPPGSVGESRKGSVGESGKQSVSESRKGSAADSDAVVHPLFVSTIQQKIFGYLSFWQQKKCRLVCRNWNAELLQSIRKRSKVNLTKLLSSLIRSASQSSSSSSSSSLPSSLSSILPILQNLNLACTSFIIEDESPGIGDFLKNSNLLIKYIELRNISWSLELVAKYILQQLPYLEELRIPIQCALPETPCSGSSSPIITEQYPKLKVIVVTYTLKDLHIYSRRNTSITSLLEILQFSPNLEEIYYPNIVQFTSPFENPARVLFKSIIYNGSMSFNRLTSLKIDTFLKNDDLIALAEKGLKLKSLQLTLTSDIGCDDLYELLYNVEPTLENLTFTFRDGFRLTKRFPPMERLTSMSVIVWNGYLDHLAEIKMLKNLVVVLMEVQMDMIQSGNLQRGSNNNNNKPPLSFSERTEINQLEIHAVPKGSDALVMKTIRLSPWNLKRLTIDHATDQYLRLIFRSLRILEELVILYGDWTESGLTGIPKEYCKADIFQKEFYAMGLKEFPGITDLKHLRTLILTGVITDFSIMMGVTKCRKIRSLELIARRNSKISDCSLMKIADVMDLHYFRMTNFTPNVSVLENGLRYLKNKFSGIELYLHV